MNPRRFAAWSVAAALVFAASPGGPAGAPSAALAQPAQAATAPACTDGRSRWLEVRNIHPRPIYYLQSRRAYSGDQWGDDMLGDTVIPSSGFVYAAMPAANCQCQADIRVTFEAERGGAGQSVEYRNIAYCSINGQQPPRLVVDN